MNPVEPMNPVVTTDFITAYQLRLMPVEKLLEMAVAEIHEQRQIIRELLSYCNDLKHNPYRGHHG